MANSDFQERLERIQASKDSGLTHSRSRVGQSGTEKSSPGQMILGCVLISLGTTTIRNTNEHYEAIRDSQGLGVANVLAIAGVLFLVFGCRSIWKWAKGREAARPAAPIAPTVVQTSSRAKATASLVGLALGTIASLVMFLAAAYNFVETGASPAMPKLLTLAALALAALAVMVGATGFVVRGRALMRVPVGFLAGGLCTYAIVMALRINTHAWLEYMPGTL